MEYLELQRAYIESDAIINEYIDRDELDQLSTSFQDEYEQLRLKIIQAQSEINGVKYNFETHHMSVDSLMVVNTAIVKLLFSYYKLVDTLVELEDVGSLMEVKAAIEDVIIDEFLSQKFDVNNLEIA